MFDNLHIFGTPGDKFITKKTVQIWFSLQDYKDFLFWLLIKIWSKYFEKKKKQIYRYTKRLSKYKNNFSVNQNCTNYYFY